MNILAIDYGQKRIGLAWVQLGLDVILPFGVIVTQTASGKPRKWRQELYHLIEQESIGRLVVGLPLGLDGNENEHTYRIRDFVRQLQNQTNLPVEFIDERFTSHEAKRYGQQGVSQDEKAAMIILEAYLNRK